jgi:hypothetical protein
MPLKPTTRRIILAAAAVLVLLVAGVGFGSWYNTFDRRFARSRPTLDAYAGQVMATDPSTPLTPPASLGSFDAGEAYRLPHGFIFRSDYGHPLDWNGLAYSTEPLPEQLPDTHPPFETMFFKPIQGNWYTVWRN